MSHLVAAFNTVVNPPVYLGGHFVSLYVTIPYYGGPEEGGWWGSDVKLVSYKHCASIEEARVLEARVGAVALRESKEAERVENAHCARQCDWLEARGLDSDSLPEVDGAEAYFVVIESKPGESEHQGDRHYS
jgi:hypothetical protein